MALIFSIIALILLAGLVRGFLQGKKAQAPSTDQGDYDPIEGLRESITQHVRGGFLTEDEIVELAVDYANDECDDSVVARVPQMVREAIATRRAEQATWPPVTDCDRLDQAFDALELEGIVARQNFTCCMTCGSSEIGGEMEERSQHGPVKGYTFYHQQDTEGAADGRGIYLAYGAESGEDDDSVAIGHRICEVLRGNGLEPDWTGDLSKRIRVPMSWQKRLPESA